METKELPFFMLLCSKSSFEMLVELPRAFITKFFIVCIPIDGYKGLIYYEWFTMNGDLFIMIDDI